jgi:hypothetical protein
LQNPAPELEDFDIGIFHPMVNLVQNQDAIDTWTWFLYTMADSNEPEIR